MFAVIAVAAPVVAGLIGGFAYGVCIAFRAGVMLCTNENERG